MNCQEVQKFLQAYLDGEFDARESAEITAHLETCEQCLEAARFEELYRNQIKRLAPRQSAPPALRGRLRRALDEVEPEQRFALGRRLWWAIPAAAALLLVVGVGLSGQIRRGGPDLVEQSISWHRRQLPMDVSGPSFERVRQFLQDKVPFAVRQPALNAPDLRLVGARLLNLGAQPAAYLTYQQGSRRISVFVYDPSAVPANGREVRVGGQRLRLRGARGYNVLMYTAGGTGYAVTADMDDQQLMRLVAHHR